MRYSIRFNMEAVPEWKSCYLAYNHYKPLLTILRETVRERIDLDDIMRYGRKQQIKTDQMISMKRIELPQQFKNEIGKHYTYFFQASNEAAKMFEQFYQQNIALFSKFVKFKYKQIQTSLQICKAFHFSTSQKDERMHKRVFKKFLQYTFVQSYFLAFMVQTNIETEWRLLAKHKLYATGLYKTVNPIANSFINIDDCHKLRRSIQRFYFRVIKKSKQKKRYRLRKLADERIENPNQSLIIGVLSGAIVTVIIFMVVILARASITLQSDPAFNRDFPLFRGISYILFYIWALGIDLHIFEKYRITHRIIFQNNSTEYPTSTDLFEIAGVFSILFVIIFTLYALTESELIGLSFSPQYLPIFLWIPFIAFIFNPFPIIFFNGRMYFLKLIGKILYSVIGTVDFPSIFGVANAISLLVIFQDLFYTVCYYSQFHFVFTANSVSQMQNACRTPAALARFIYTIVIYAIRIIQCIKIGLNIGSKYWNKKQFLNSIKFTMSLLTAILAYVWQQKSNNSIQSSLFPAWLVFAILSTTFSIVWDIKFSWDLLHTESKNYLLRDQLIFPKINYFIWAIIDCILRCTWTLNISPSIVRGLFGSPQIFLLVFGFLQIFRRAMWNLMRVQVEQIKNNEQLRALPRQYQNYRTEIQDYVKKNKDKLTSVSIQRFVQPDLQIIKNEVQIDVNMKQSLKKIKQDIKEEVKKLKQLKRKQTKRIKQLQRENKEKIKYLLQKVY